MTTNRVTNTGILEQLACGTMTCAQLAHAFNAAPERVQSFLDALLQGKRICVDTRVVADIGYQIVRVSRASREKPNTSIAGPHLPPNLQSSLTGYDTNIRRHIELCMMARAR